ncbi:hypothetical protein RHSIM_Rhsim08G0145500 [Rhododendron simsii]|uniref:Uncharacterized protein n=1 Tax=Rhododendron simsii TaxID=118357 RepID=A0A834GPH5_RHOSS|nr:hypothetical protein RHSIM_Rhsim08G0145500 [Rhododendron simsii]
MLRASDANSLPSLLDGEAKNWEQLVRATLRREKLRHDGRGGHERALSVIAGSILPSLTRETNIDMILPAADEIQSKDPNVARIRPVSIKILQLCHLKRLGFSAFVSRRLSSLYTNQLWTSYVTMNAFGLLRNRSAFYKPHRPLFVSSDICLSPETLVRPSFVSSDLAGPVPFGNLYQCYEAIVLTVLISYLQHPVISDHRSILFCCHKAAADLCKLPAAS